MSRGRKKVAFIGGTEKGKSTQIKIMLGAIQKLFSTEGIIIYDLNYQKAWSYLSEITMEMWAAMKSGMYRIHDADFMKFYSIAKDKWKTGWRGVIVHEDAGEVITAQKNEKLYAMLIGLRHKATDLVFVFHSIADVPKYIMRQLNEIVLFKTGDNWDDIKDRFPDDKVEEVRQAFERVNNHKDNFYFERIILRKTGTL